MKNSGKHKLNPKESNKVNSKLKVHAAIHHQRKREKTNRKRNTNPASWMALKKETRNPIQNSKSKL